MPGGRASTGGSKCRTEKWAGSSNLLSRSRCSTTQMPTSVVYPAGRPCCPCLCSARPPSTSSALNQGPLTRYLLSFQMTSLALACLEAPLAFVRGNKIENYASSSRCGDLGDQLPPVSGRLHTRSTHAPHHTTPLRIINTNTTATQHLRVQTQNYTLHLLSTFILPRVAREPKQNPIGLFQVVIQRILFDLSPAYTLSLTHTRKPLLFPLLWFVFLFFPTYQVFDVIV